MNIFQLYQGIVEYAIVRDDYLKPSSNSSDGTSGSLQQLLSPYKNLAICSLKLFGCFSLLLFICFQAKTFPEFSESIFSFFTLVVCLIFTRIFYLNRELIFNLINNFERVIDKRKLIFLLLFQISKIFLCRRIDESSIENPLRRSKYIF